MGYEVGVACASCDAFGPLGSRFCAFCGVTISLLPVVGASEPNAVPLEAPHAATEVAAYVVAEAQQPDATDGPPLRELRRGGDEETSGTERTEEQKEIEMDQARHYVCKECCTPVPSGHKFCGRCGGVVPPQILELRTEFFGAMQAPGKARLILIRGDAGTDGLSYLLQGTEHVAGRKDGQIVFPEDKWMSPRHANFLYRGDRLIVRDEGSKNGVYVRVRGQTPIEPGDAFLVGEQVFRLDRSPADTAGPEPDMTYFYSSPRRPSPFRITQILRGGFDGTVICAKDNQASVGREDCDLNYPEDLYMSGSHARIVASPDGSFTLIDNGSKNGTYLRIRGERELAHGDYLFLGRQLLRVEITA
jgi:pSer/pThr/pTyr-binding forkhead associated (FHA) protein